MVATSQTPVTVWSALSARITMGVNVRCKMSHSMARPSTVVDCEQTEGLLQRVGPVSDQRVYAAQMICLSARRRSIC